MCGQLGGGPARLLGLLAVLALLLAGCARGQETRPLTAGELQRGRLAGVRARGAELARVAWAGEDLSGADLRGADLTRADLTGAVLRGAKLAGANLGGAKLAGADLREADLEDAKLGRATLTRAQAAGANLQGAVLVDASLDEADLRGARLADVTASGSSLGRAQLDGVNLERAHLQFANLAGAKLAGADLRFANLTRARLTGADLKGARYNGSTQWPAGFQARAQGTAPVRPRPAATAAAVLLILAGAYFMLRRVDVRLVLALCAAGLFALAENFPPYFSIIAQQMTNERTVVPICSAMGFAFVLKRTGCDQHLIHLLLQPLSRVQPLLIPGGIAVAYLVNTTVVSQSSTAAAVGPVLVPLLLAAGLSPLTAGAALMLGASMGGELFNPGSVEIVTLASITDQPPVAVVARVMRPNLIASGVALAVFWWLSVRAEKGSGFRVQSDESDRSDVSEKSDGSDGPDGGGRGPHFRVNLLKAVVPLLPLALLFTLPRFLDLPRAFSVEERLFDTDSVFISAAMLLGVVAAGLSAPREVTRLPAAFFEGAGYAYTIVISLIITATLFAEGLKANGLIEMMAQALAGLPAVTTLASVGIPGLLATATGSGIAPAVAVMRALVPVAQDMHLDPVRLGALTAVSAQLGRTISPVAAVAITSAAISGTAPMDLARRVLPAVLAGAAVMLAAALVGLV